jgi:UDP-glucose 4-epimerase
MKVLVTGGAGYIGSHTCLELALRGHDVVIVDSFANSSKKVLPRLEALSGRRMVCHELDLRDEAALKRLFADEACDAVIHFAALKAVGDSCEQPLEYFDNNIGGSISLLRAMQTAGVDKLIFSSSCTVYGAPDSVPVNESAPLRVANPYGRTKLFVEEMLTDLARAEASFRYVSLRYFNPVGAHPSGRIGEDSRGPPTNLMPIVCQVAIGRRDKLLVWGGDWPTPDGTGVRDYLHVVDLAKAHVSALEYLVEGKPSLAVNLGTGKGASVLELVQAFERVSGKSIPYEIVARRDGDVAAIWADPSLAAQELGWTAELDLEAMCLDAWRWQSENPVGYEA